MARKRRQQVEEEQRQSRKEMLLARRQARQTRQIRLAVGGVIALLLVVLIVGIVNEVAIKPSLPVAEVNGVEITMRDWQDRVRFQRAQLITSIEDLADALGGEIGQVQQFAGQQIDLLMEGQTLGQLVLDQLVDEELIRQGAVERDISISDEALQKEIEENFGYYGGKSPTATPTSTQTPVPTPSLTPIPTAVITEVLPTSTPFPTTTPFPTSTPGPTSTPISLASFEESYDETIDRFKDLNSDEAVFRSVILAQLYRERMQDAIALEEELPDEAEHVSFFYLTFESEEEAQETLQAIDSQDYLTVWNTIKSRPFDAEDDSTAIASEVLWRTQDDVENIFDPDLAETAFTLPLNETSDVLVVPAETEEESDSYYIISVSGREIRPLSEAAIRSAKQETLASWLDGQRQGDLEVFERWRTNVPRQPVLDPKYLVQPTPVPATPTFDLPELILSPTPQTTPEP